MYNVIIVDDEPEVAKITRAFIERSEDFNVTAVFSNGQEALNYIWLNNVDLIFLDLYMPCMDGKEFLYRLRKENINTDVVVVTAAQDVGNLKEVLPFGILDYMLKPFEYQRLWSTLEKFMTRRKVIGGAGMITQNQIDSMMLYPSSTQTQDIGEILLEKGLQTKTYEKIKTFMIDNKSKKCTAEFISENTGLSKVTIRRYMNYMIEIHEILSEVDYNTGGRPSIVYRYIL